MRRFYIERVVDQSGVSGTGRVLHGCIYPSGKTVIEWREPHTTITVFESFEQFEAIHVKSHPNTSAIVFLDSEEKAKEDESIREMAVRLQRLEAVLFPPLFKSCGCTALQSCPECQP